MGIGIDALVCDRDRKQCTFKILLAVYPIKIMTLGSMRDEP